VFIVDRDLRAPHRPFFPFLPPFLSIFFPFPSLLFFFSGTLGSSPIVLPITPSLTKKPLPGAALNASPLSLFCAANSFLPAGSGDLSFLFSASSSHSLFSFAAPLKSTSLERRLRVISPPFPPHMRRFPSFPDRLPTLPRPVPFCLLCVSASFLTPPPGKPRACFFHRRHFLFSPCVAAPTEPVPFCFGLSPAPPFLLAIFFCIVPLL